MGQKHSNEILHAHRIKNLKKCHKLQELWRSHKKYNVLNSDFAPWVVNDIHYGVWLPRIGQHLAILLTRAITDMMQNEVKAETWTVKLRTGNNGDKDFTEPLLKHALDNACEWVLNQKND